MNERPSAIRARPLALCLPAEGIRADGRACWEDESAACGTLPCGRLASRPGPFTDSVDNEESKDRDCGLIDGCPALCISDGRRCIQLGRSVSAICGVRWSRLAPFHCRCAHSP